MMIYNSNEAGQMIPAQYTEVLDNLLRYEDSATAINNAMSSYPLYQTDNSKIKEFGTSYKVPSRKELNTKILSYYRFREIAFETVGRFIFELETALNEIMPKYNQLFYSADQDFNPIYNVDYVKTSDRKKSGSTIGNALTKQKDSSIEKNNSRVETNEKNVNSKTPQNQLNISNSNIDSVSYADEANWLKNNNTTNNDTTTNNTSNVYGENTNIDNEKEGITEKIKGNFGVVSAQDLIIKYRESIINIEQMIIKDPRISELFMLIF